jgi:hypothetical protein
VRIDRDQIEARSGHRDEQHAADHDTPILRERRECLFHVRAMPALLEFLRFRELAAKREDERHDHAADEKRHAPSPRGDRRGIEPLIDRVAERGRHDDCDLLAGGLPAREETLAARCRHFGEIDRHATQFRAGRKTLQQAANQNQGGGSEPYRGIAGDERDENGPARHDRQRHDQAFAAADVIDIGTQDDRAEWPHEKACAEHGEGHHQRREIARCREENGGDLRGIKTEQKEIELLEEVARRHADDDRCLGLPGKPGAGGRMH